MLRFVSCRFFDSRSPPLPFFLFFPFSSGREKSCGRERCKNIYSLTPHSGDATEVTRSPRRAMPFFFSFSPGSKAIVFESRLSFSGFFPHCLRFWASPNPLLLSPFLPPYFFVIHDAQLERAWPSLGSLSSNSRHNKRSAATYWPDPSFFSLEKIRFAEICAVCAFVAEVTRVRHR